MFAESQDGLVRPGRQRLRPVCAALIVLVLALVLSLTAFYTVCSGFRFYDDMGYLMLTQKMFATGHALYDQIYTHYGPAYYAYVQLLHTLTRLPVSHDATLLFTTGSWVLISLLCAGYVARITRNLILTVLTCLAVFDLLLVLTNEPGHPQELCGVLLGGMLLASSFLTCRRHTELILGVIGFLVGLLSMSKPNLGIFAALAGWVSLTNLLAARTWRNLLFGAGALAALSLPVMLMRHNLAPAGDYCLLVSGAVLLLIVQLATSQPDRSLPLRVLVAPVVGCAAVVLGCAGYALARGTSVAGLIHGLVGQNIGFDRLFSMWPTFGVKEVLCSLGLALVVWVMTGPGGGLWHYSRRGASIIKSAVAPLMMLAVLVAANVDTDRPWFSSEFTWLNPAFVWLLPLVVATGQLSARQPKAACEVAPRQFAMSLAVLGALWGYPVWGSQAQLAFFLLIPVGMVWCADGLRYGYSEFETMKLFSSPRSKAAGMAFSYLSALAIVGLAWAWADSAAQAYHRLQPSGLRGSRLLHMPQGQADVYRRLVQAAHAHGRSFFTEPGLGSLHFWADVDPPTCLYATAWMTLLTPAQQSKVVEDLQKTPDLCVIRGDPIVEFWTHGSDISGNKIVRYIEDNFLVVESFGGYDVLVRRPAAGHAHANQGAGEAVSGDDPQSKK
jgi:hypothetical protein